MLNGSPTRKWYPLLLLAPTQVLSWGTLYYGITFLAEPIHKDTGWTLSAIFGAYTAGLIVAALCTPFAGSIIAQFGGRCVLAAGSMLAALAMAVIGLSLSPTVFYIGWIIAGVAMAATLYEAAFATLREISGLEFRRNVAALVIVGGLASTVAWPVSSWLVVTTDWRTVFLLCSAIHLLCTLPLHLALPSAHSRDELTYLTDPSPQLEPTPGLTRGLGLFAAAFSLSAMVSGSVSAHVGLLLSAQGVERQLALLAVALIGPMQIAGRLVDLLGHRFWSIWSVGYLALLAPAVGVILLLGVGDWPWLVFGFAVLYGFGLGLITIVKAMVPGLLAETRSYAQLNGWMSAPSLFARAAAPLLFAFMLELTGACAAILMLVVIGLLSVIVFTVAVRVTRSVLAPHGRTLDQDINIST